MKYLLALVVLVGAAFAQNCDQVVYDQAGILGDDAGVRQAAQEMIQKGADVRIRTWTNAPNLDAVEKENETACASWRGGTGERKSTLIVLAVAPNERKMGMYYGSAWSSALDGHWNRIKQEQMGPRFKEKDWAGGFVAAEQHIAQRLGEASSEALHPAVTQITTTNEAADYSGLWSFLKWMLFIAVVMGAFGFLYSWWSRRRRLHEAARQQQLRAIRFKQQCSSLIYGMSAEQKEKLSGYLSQFEELSQSVKNDPSQDGLTEAEYAEIGDQYRDLQKRMYDAVYPNLKYVRDMSTRIQSEKKEKRVEQKAEERKEKEREVVREGNTNVVVVAPTTRVESEPEPEHHHASHHRDDDDNSSSWSGSSGSGGSSSFDWGSSSGGGGSSSFDFGGGGGGGGSSDF